METSIINKNVTYDRRIIQRSDGSLYQPSSDLEGIDKELSEFYLDDEGLFCHKVSNGRFLVKKTTGCDNSKYSMMLVENCDSQSIKMFYSEENSFIRPDENSINDLSGQKYIVYTSINRGEALALFIYDNDKLYSKLNEMESASLLHCIKNIKYMNKVVFSKIMHDSFAKTNEVVEIDKPTTMPEIELKEFLCLDTYTAETQKRVKEIHSELNSRVDRTIRNKYRSMLKYIFGISVCNQQYSPILDYFTIKRIVDSKLSGMLRIKEIIVKYLYTSQFTKTIKPICLVGSPGTGKTTLAKIIAEILNKIYVRIKCAGVDDALFFFGEEIVFDSATVGEIVSKFYQIGTTCCLMLFDEIDKMTNGIKNGDPFAVLSDMFEPNTNIWYDKFLQCTFNTSGTTFVCTANTTDTIPKYLLSRMEIIEFDDYSNEDKFHIAKDHLVNEVLDDIPRFKNTIKFTDEALKTIVSYTNDGGCRESKTLIREVVRDAVSQIPLYCDKKFIIDSEFVEKCTLITQNNHVCGF